MILGYGNLAPTGPMGRILTMVYALIGIPMNGILLSQLGEYFSRAFVKAHQKYKSYKHSSIDCPKKLTPLETGKAGLAAQILMYLCPGFVMFIFFPAFLFSHYEGWSYEESVYYAFVTLTTIGFGDYVAGKNHFFLLIHLKSSNDKICEILALIALDYVIFTFRHFTNIFILYKLPGNNL